MNNDHARNGFHWINQDYLNGSAEILEFSSILLHESVENPGASRLVMYIGIEDSFRFPHPLYRQSDRGNL